LSPLRRPFQEALSPPQRCSLLFPEPTKVVKLTGPNSFGKVSADPPSILILSCFASFLP